MQLAHLIPHLDAEISRLQKARDLLALLPLDASSFTAPSKAQQTRLSAFPATDVSSTVTKTRADEPAKLGSGPAVLTDKVLFVKEPRAPGESRAARRKPVLLLDTALRGPVPAGPVAVSADEVRRSQAAKTAQAVRAAEVKKSGAELASSFSWRNNSSDKQTVAALLQKLIRIGEEEPSANTVGLRGL